jgi:hypothetical protein
MTLNGIVIQSAEHLNELIADLPDESKIALQALFAEEQSAAQ